MSKTDLPTAVSEMGKHHPEVWEAFQKFGEACSEAGPIDAKTKHLIKIAAAIAIRSEGATHSHVRRALDEGAAPDEIRHVSLLAAPSRGAAWPPGSVMRW